ncbi:endoplasmic reticulum oxidoreductin [Plasmodium falciparum RAJ116]|uniref:Endoplasmic reticulum oxidoreductin n=1 Tax=Plasmodium falciparum RAJ116 TaxID=580058 RepID=A0A0L0CWL4_PLAFA|nr:endoplasmic reticulum oxidoreductin [Plasmodium falciparum RAJ116]
MKICLIPVFLSLIIYVILFLKGKKKGDLYITELLRNKFENILLYFNIFEVQYPESYLNNEKLLGLHVRDIEKDAYRAYPILKELKQKDYFRIFKVNLHLSCKVFLKGNEKCKEIKKCSVCECEQDEIPYNFRTNEIEIIENKMTNEDLKKTFIESYEQNDKEAVRLLDDLLENFYHSCSSKEFLEPLFPQHGKDILSKFMNITNILDCVPCVKCRLHGKLKTTALQIALVEGVSDEHIGSLERNEITALINALYYFADSILIINKFEDRLKLKKTIFIFYELSFSLFLFLEIYSIIFLTIRNYKKKKKKVAYMNICIYIFTKGKKKIK